MTKQTRYLLLLLISILLFSIHAQKAPKPGRRPLPRVSAKAVSPDSISKNRADSLRADSINKKKSKSALDDQVKYKSNDSIIFTGTKFAQMFGDAQIDFKDIELKADYIQMNLDSSVVYATGQKDSVGQMSGKPKFKDKGGNYDSETMRYNFKSKRGYITNVITEQGEGFVVGGKTKKMPNDELYMTDCKYTTCDNHDHPHFYFNLTKAKVIPKKNIVTGPAYLVLEDVPLPLAIPFGFFPFSKKYSSGVIIPTYGDELTRGFYLRDGGYYFAINDYVDMAVTGEIFTKGSWGLGAVSNYMRKYKYTGSFNIGYRNTITGEKGSADYSKAKDFNLTWSHSQDSKANPYMTFSASVNFSTSSYDRNDLGGVYDPNRFTQNNKSSSVNISRVFPNTPFSVSSSMNISQRSSDSSVVLSLPDLNISMSRIFPFKRKSAVGKERWYEKIGFSYSGILRNSIDTKEDLLFKSNLIKDWRNGMQHNVPVSATFNLLKYINITPSVNYSESWFSNKIMKDWDPVSQMERNDTIWGFNRMYRYSTSISASTKLYGFYTPLPIFGKKIQTIRHVFTPGVSFSYTPNFQNEKFGFWRAYSYVNTQGERITKYYSPYEGGLFYSAPSTTAGSVAFNMTNNLEMKIRTDRDTSGVRKISLIDNFTTGISYNMAADSMNWSNINASIRLKLPGKFSLNLAGDFDTYTYQLNSAGSPVRVNRTRWEKNRTLGRLQNTGTSFSYTLNNDTFKKLFSKDKSKKKTADVAGTTDEEKPDVPAEEETDKPKKKKEDKSKSTFDEDGYMVWSVPWNLSFNYSMRYGYSDFNKEKLEYNRSITHNLGFSGSLTLTKGWSFSMSSSYDFDAKKISYTNINVSRDLHCWQMTAGVVPFGQYRSYNFSISVKSAMLKDLKYDKRGNSYDAVPWY